MTMQAYWSVAISGLPLLSFGWVLLMVWWLTVGESGHIVRNAPGTPSLGKTGAQR
jgi:hypothetical protein